METHLALKDSLDHLQVIMEGKAPLDQVVHLQISFQDLLVSNPIMEDLLVMVKELLMVTLDPWDQLVDHQVVLLVAMAYLEDNHLELKGCPDHPQVILEVKILLDQAVHLLTLFQVLLAHLVAILIVLDLVVLLVVLDQ